MLKLVRTNSENNDFIHLIEQLDAYLKITDEDEHDFYNQFNAINSINHVIVAYLNEEPVACGAIKVFSQDKVEVKRMFSTIKARNKGIATKLLKELEDWAISLNYRTIILETGIRQIEAVAFYKKNLYESIPNYGQYIGVNNSLCFQKTLKN